MLSHWIYIVNRTHLHNMGSHAVNLCDKIILITFTIIFPSAFFIKFKKHSSQYIEFV